jgi:beta-glucosidase
MLKFPDGFLWGAATSHFQIEGNPFEISNRSSDWSEWTVSDGHIDDGSTADRACEFYSRYAEDIKLLKELNLKAFRISLNWASICPNPGDGLVNREEIQYYRRLLTQLKQEGITTFVTLYHFCTPRWLAEKGGWLNKIIVDEFAKFARLAAEEFGDLVDYWTTINEPLVYAYQGYIKGIWPPGYKGEYFSAFACVRNMLEAHARAYHAIHDVKPNAQVSFVIHWSPFQPANPMNPLDRMVRYFRESLFIHAFPNAVKTGVFELPFPLNLTNEAKKLCGPVPNLKDTWDHLAINYYTRDICQFDYRWPIDVFGIKSPRLEREVDAMGWENYPEGLYNLLTKDSVRYHFDEKGVKRPIFITENGYAGRFASDLVGGDWSLDDQERIKYLSGHLQALHKSLSAGVNLKGYLYWALLDNFEWAHGLQMRFGLVRVAFPTQERTLRKSAYYYANIARQNALDPAVL